MEKSLSVSIVGKGNNDSREKVRRYIRLAELIPELLKLVDDGFIKDRRTSLVLGITNKAEEILLENCTCDLSFKNKLL